MLVLWNFDICLPLFCHFCYSTFCQLAELAEGLVCHKSINRPLFRDLNAVLDIEKYLLGKDKVISGSSLQH